MDFLSLQSVPPPSLTMEPGLLASPARSRDPRAIDAVATGFESMFVSLLIKQLRQTLEEGSMFAGDSGDILGGLFDFTLGQHLAQAGALGIGDLLRQQLAQRYGR
jgi:Rod binding domain-containing protein